MTEGPARDTVFPVCLPLLDAFPYTGASRLGAGPRRWGAGGVTSLPHPLQNTRFGVLSRDVCTFLGVGVGNPSRALSIEKQVKPVLSCGRKLLPFSVVLMINQYFFSCSNVYKESTGSFCFNRNNVALFCPSLPHSGLSGGGEQGGHDWECPGAGDRLGCVWRMWPCYFAVGSFSG